MRTFSIAAALVFASSAYAAETPPSSCNTPEHHQMDFWLGTWVLTWEGGKGINRITRDFKNCVIVENFQEDAHDKPPLLRGMSISSYQPLNKMWRQTWVDDQNGYYHLSGGRQADGTFMLQNIRMGREPQMLRMVFEKITPESFTWRWQGSEDGETWTDKWVIQYRRAEDLPAR